MLNSTQTYQKPLENSKFRRHWHFLAITRSSTVATRKHTRLSGNRQVSKHLTIIGKNAPSAKGPPRLLGLRGVHAKYWRAYTNSQERPTSLFFAGVFSLTHSSITPMRRGIVVQKWSYTKLT